MLKIKYFVKNFLTRITSLTKSARSECGKAVVWTPVR